MSFLDIEVECVTLDEIERLAEWCHGEIGTQVETLSGEERIYIQVDLGNLLPTYANRVFEGDWIVKDEHCKFKALSDAEYKATFMEAHRHNEKFQKILGIVQKAMMEQDQASRCGARIDTALVAEMASFEIMDL